MAKKKHGGSLTSLMNQKKKLREQLSAIKKKKRDMARAEKLKKEVASLKHQLHAKKKHRR